MSRIDELIADLCPDGVQFKTLGDAGTFIRGKSLQKKDFAESGVGCIHYGQIHTHYGTWALETISFVSPVLAKTLRHAKCGDLVIATTSEDDEAVGKAVAWLGAEAVAVSSDAYIYRHSLDPKYLAYFFQSTQFRIQKQPHITGTKVRRLSGESLARIRVPVPPLKLQREIAKVLDAFAELEAELEADLEAELDTRRRQYEYYRRALLGFADQVQTDVRCMTLGDVGKVCMCRRVLKHETSAEGEVPFYKIGTFGGTPDAFISRELYNAYRSRYPFPKSGDILLSAAGTIGRAISYDGEPGYFQDSNIVWIGNDESVVTNRYLYHWYHEVEWTTDGGAIQRLYNEKIRRAKIAVPPLEEQARVVGVLERFDALVRDISIALPAELKARRQQYEYYRDRLLTFPEAGRFAAY